MKYELDKQDAYTLVRVLEDKLDAAVAPDLKTTFVSLGNEGVRSLVIDLGEVRYIDSSGLSALLIANRLCADKQGTFVLTRVGDHVMKLIKISQLDKVLNILPLVEEGIDLVYMNDLEQDLRSQGDEAGE